MMSVSDTIFSAMTRLQSPSEVLTDVLHNYGEGTLVHAALVKSTIQITEEMLANTLTVLKDYQPALRMTIHKESRGSTSRTKKSGDRFQEMEAVELKVEVRTVTGGRDVWMQCIETELERPLNVDGDTKWKLIYLQFGEDDDISLECSTTSSATGQSTGVLLFKMHPSMCDDVSLFDLVYQQMIHVLNRVSSGYV